ncbi:hypothetical protein K438DRAFT_1775585 [Mycena galopus ATCC 62051]|nr:hypothetical protein K438DRAFT_1775585 [Mycena galopus ATCC 62051]
MYMLLLRKIPGGNIEIRGSNSRLSEPLCPIGPNRIRGLDIRHAVISAFGETAQGAPNFRSTTQRSTYYPSENQGGAADAALRAILFNAKFWVCGAENARSKPRKEDRKQEKFDTHDPHVRVYSSENQDGANPRIDGIFKPQRHAAAARKQPSILGFGQPAVKLDF